MRKLKAHRIVGMNEECARIENDFYLKTEVDKVISDLEESHKMEVEQLLILNREQAISGNKLRDSMEQAIRHQKFKRCLAMANGCEYLCAHYQFREVYEKRDFFRKWMFRWLKITEQFKEQR